MAPIAFGGRGGGRGFKSPGRGGRGELIEYSVILTNLFQEAAAEVLPEVEAVSVDAEEVEEEAEDVEDLEEEAVEVAEEVALKLSSNPIVTGVSSSPRAKKMSLSPRTWFPATPSMARRRLRLKAFFRSKKIILRRSKSQHQRDLPIQSRRLSTDRGTPSGQSWLLLFSAVSTKFTSPLARRY